MHGISAGEKTTVIPLKNFSDYFLENVATPGQNWQQLQITSACDARCSFCSNDQNAFETARARFRDVKEIEKVVYAAPFNNDDIFLNESLPGRMSEGEALIHPKLFDILNIIRSKFPHNVIRMTTSGSRLTSDMIEKLTQFKPIKITLSIPSVDEKHWTEIYKLKTRHYENFVNSIPHLQRNGIDIMVNMTPMPAHVGYDDIEKTIEFLVKNNLRYLFIYAPGYTKYTPENIAANLKYDKEEMSEFLHTMSKKHGIRIDWYLDPKREIFVNFDNIINVTNNFFVNGVEKSYWLVSKAAYQQGIENKLKKLTRLIPHEIVVVPVENRSYGGNIEVSGLWMVSDIRDTINDLQIKNQHCIVPRTFLDKYGFDLNGENILDYIKKAENYIYLIDV